MCSEENTQFRLKWHEWKGYVASSVTDILEQEAFTDVTLACQGQTFMAHRFVLAASSGFFKQVLQYGCINEHPILILTDVELPELKALLHFMYYGEATVSHDRIRKLLDTAHRLQVRGLSDHTQQQNDLPLDLEVKNSSEGEKEQSPPNKKRRSSESKAENKKEATDDDCLDLSVTEAKCTVKEEPDVSQPVSSSVREDWYGSLSASFLETEMIGDLPEVLGFTHRLEMLHGMGKSVRKGQRGRLKRHLSGEGTLLNLSKDDNDAAEYPCGDCGRIFRHPRSLLQHRHFHRGTHTCPECKKPFSRRWDLNRHILSTSCLKRIPGGDFSLGGDNLLNHQHSNELNGGERDGHLLNFARNSSSSSREAEETEAAASSLLNLTTSSSSSSSSSQPTLLNLSTAAPAVANSPNSDKLP